MNHSLQDKQIHEVYQQQRHWLACCTHLQRRGDLPMQRIGTGLEGSSRGCDGVATSRWDTRHM